MGHGSGSRCTSGARERFAPEGCYAMAVAITTTTSYCCGTEMEGQIRVAELVRAQQWVWASFYNFKFGDFLLVFEQFLTSVTFFVTFDVNFE